ncbi:group II intron reverse transcriptase/maturase [bacterium]|nr:group II intron reverse transcriptase/maturase [bacterium]
MSKGRTGNLGDPKRFPAKGIGSFNSVNRGEKVKGSLGVGSANSRGNGKRNLTEALKAPQLVDILEKGALEGADGQSQRHRETSSTLRSGRQTETKLERITGKARANKKYKFRALASLLDEGFLAECFVDLKKGKAPGVDGMSLKEYEPELSARLQQLVERMKKGSYRPQPVRRAYIPKANGAKRPLGIPTVEDKIVQMGITKILEAMFEANFLDASYGYRKGRSCHSALAAVDKAIMERQTNFVVDADIKGFFDNVNHKWMIEFLKQRVADKNFLRLIARFLKAGVMEEGKYLETDRGTPQGGILSPVLSNVYLHYVLDLWLEMKLKQECKGYVEEIRYCDDFIISVQIRADGEKIMEALKERLAKFGLTLSEEKARLIGFGRYERQRAAQRNSKPATFDFLGITHYCDRMKWGKFKISRRTSAKKFQLKVGEMNEWLKSVYSTASGADIWKVLKAKLVGHYRYYGVSGNYESIRRFYYLTERLIFKWLNRRSQKRSFNWKQFQTYLKRYPLPKPRLYRNLNSSGWKCETA